MALETASLRRNLSRLELAISIVIIALLVAVFMRRVATVELAAEQAILKAQYQDMQSRLATLRISLLSGGGALTMDDIARHLGRGELTFAASADGIDWSTIEPGAWVYLRDSGQIVYRVINAGRFPGTFGRPPRVRFQIQPTFADTNGNGRYDAGRERLSGARLTLLDRGALHDAAPRG